MNLPEIIRKGCEEIANKMKLPLATQRRTGLKNWRNAFPLFGNLSALSGPAPFEYRWFRKNCLSRRIYDLPRPIDLCKKKSASSMNEEINVNTFRYISGIIASNILVKILIVKPI